MKIKHIWNHHLEFVSSGEGEQLLCEARSSSPVVLIGPLELLWSHMPFLCFWCASFETSLLIIVDDGDDDDDDDGDDDDISSSHT